MKLLTETIDLVNIIFSIILFSLVFVLIAFHIYTEIKDKRSKRLEKKLFELINKDNVSTLGICKIRRIYTMNGLRALEEISKKLNPTQLVVLRATLSEEKFLKFVKRQLNSKQLSKAVLATKLVIGLGYNQFNKEIVNNLKRWNNSEAQQIGLLALFLNGCKNELIALFSDESFKLLISFRTSQELVSSYSGDKIDFFKTLFKEKIDNYILRASIQTIGAEKITELSDMVMVYLDSENLNIAISAIRALGDLKCKKVEDKLVVMLQESEWEVTCAIVEALAKINPEKAYDIIFPFVFHTEWWVRLRTAEALVSLPDNEKLIRDIKNSQDKYALEMISYMIEKNKLIKAGEINGK